MLTSWSDGVAERLVVVSVAWYLRYRMPWNWASESPLAKNVAGVLTGPTNVNGPEALLLAAARNVIAVPAGVSAVQVSVPQFTMAPGTGFASLAEETNVPEG